ncbi:probable glycosyl transferase [Rivularia sp. IAM M-261]|nr:probable glycosyl transferase [Calothrix sp. PCC 7716]GJD16074.1 probable glycosyl transferase [Rivularia sp. IAM M-261]
MTKVSVIIPAYNAMRYLPQTLDSVLQQTFTDYEVIIVNDGSSDSIMEWAPQSKDSRIRLITQSNQGVSAARNTGFVNSQGEYIAFLDADDLWVPEYLEKQVEYLDKYVNVGVVYTWTKLIDELGNSINRIFASHASGMIWKELLTKDVISTGSSAMVRRQCIENVGAFDAQLAYAEDLDFWLRITQQYEFGVIKEPLVYYRQHPYNVTKNRKKMMHGLQTVYERAFATAPLDMLYLRNQAYASLFIGFAWLAIDDKDIKTAIKYRKQAFLHYPFVSFKESYFRLNLAIFMMRLFGNEGYNGVRNLTRYFKRIILNFTKHIDKPDALLRVLLKSFNAS